jgi:type I restriction enzyme, S subunit
MILPAGWQLTCLDELITDIDAGKNVRCEERPPTPSERGIIKISAVTWGSFDPNEAKTAPSNMELPPNTLIQDGDFLISRANTLELVGASVIVEHTPGNLYLSDKVLRLRMDREVARWVNLFLKSSHGRAEIEKRATGNQLSMRNIGQGALRAVELPLPPSPSSAAS